MNQAESIHKLTISQASPVLEQQHSFPLFVGGYEGFDASESALDMMRKNIQFHHVLVMREFEGIKNTSTNIAYKKEMLEQSLADAAELLIAARKAGKKVKVEADIKISIG